MSRDKQQTLSFYDYLTVNVGFSFDHGDGASSRIVTVDGWPETIVPKLVANF